MLYRETKLSIAAILVIGLAILSFMALTPNAGAKEKANIYNSVTVPATAQGLLSQCGDTFFFKADPKNYGVIPSSYDKTSIPIHPMIVPVYGYMSSQPFNTNKLDGLVKGQNPYQYPDIIRALWQNYLVVWISPNYSEDGYKFLTNYEKKWNAQHPEQPMVVLSWTGDTPLPQGRDIGFSAWGVSQTCQTFSTETFQVFVDNVNKKAQPRDFNNPPQAELVNGSLPSFNLSSKKTSN